MMLSTGTSGLRAVMADSSHVFPRHTHDEFGIGVICAGGQISASGRGQVTAGAGDVITVNPGEVHDGAPLRGERRHWQMLYFDPDLISDLHRAVHPGASTDFEFTAPVLSNEAIAAALLAAFRQISTGVSIAPRLASEQALLQLLAPLMQIRPAPMAPRRHPEIRRARTLLDDMPEANLSLAQLAAEAGLSRFQTLRAFTASYGMTPHAYVMQRRANIAKQLIIKGTGLAAAATEAGYADQSHMTRDFRRRYGLTPAVFQQIS
ncbi:AraC family transcriptional regulator [Rhizobiaceae bacterium n13]|uniref:AraC family transcriptional regulator n=1 Tax=Ferirhizobium litorale TaxID=2927786 RepID=A0AAE3QCC1_9HYPH|nr:AraC family transcriptional regulator [Fererhizobium litorale]MDI7860872.1 AraC family transcriptional regulator [Fererhizobium litorale]MDI7921020.1 AraC family transcriptional regulator [Fererhizobium litorale]